ncbi:MAG: hypothetical protein Q4F80_07010, partial [bacterium]|nr:hypothetical protein [bacterium]
MINLLIVLFGVSMLYMATSSRIGAQINMLRLQGVILCLITFIAHGPENFFMLLFLLLETFIVKALVIPSFLSRVAKKNNIRRDNNPNFPNFYTLVISTIVLFTGFLIANIHSKYMTNISSLYFGISVSTIITSFLFIAIKKKLLTHVIGFAMLENGIFLLSLAVAKEMPLIVNLGVLLDVFVAVFIL